MMCMIRLAVTRFAPVSSFLHEIRGNSSMSYDVCSAMPSQRALSAAAARASTRATFVSAP
eukprot:6184418-Pleurochrysis_carterae.AAC.5